MPGSISDEGNYKELGEPCKEKGSLVVFNGECFASICAVFVSELFSFKIRVLGVFSTFGVTDFLIARTDLTPRFDYWTLLNDYTGGFSFDSLKSGVSRIFYVMRFEGLEPLARFYCIEKSMLPALNSSSFGLVR